MDLDAICGWNPIVEQAYSQRDTMLYALGLGYGEDPLDSRELPFVYEHELKAVPAMCMVLAQNKFWLSVPIYVVDAARLRREKRPVGKRGCGTGKSRGGP